MNIERWKYVGVLLILFDMLAKKFRLKWKDVNFLTKRRQYCPAGIFGIFYVVQYPNNKFNQISFHVSIKVSKNATIRNMVKRIVLNYIRQNNLTPNKSGQVWYSFDGKYYKMYLTLNKNRIPELQKVIETKDRKSIVEYVQKNLSYWLDKFKSFVVSK